MGSMTNFYYIFTILCLFVSILLTAVTWFLIKRNRYRLLFGMALIATMMSYFLTLSIFVLQINNQLVIYLYLILMALILIPVVLLTIFSAFLFIWNGLIVWRRESHSLGNLLTLVIGILLIMMPVLFNLLNHYLPNNKIVTFIENVSYSCQNYLVFWVLAFLASYFLTKIVKPKYNKEYAIVLGSGLINGDTVSPLLGSRILIAAKFKAKQLAKSKKKMILIMSGGQGSDEKLPESVAMKAYAIKNGVPESDILVDDQSKNTYQNMLFSKQIIIDNGLDLQKGIFTTNDYHVFRAAGFARLVGLNIDGIGSKTSKYFLPNALIREYIAILVKHKKFHFCAVILIIIINSLIFLS